MDNRYIVALEIGSSKIKGLVASVGDLGEINVIAVEETRMIDCVRYGRIQNVQEVSSYINEIIRKIENNPRVHPRKVTDIFVSLGGRSLSTVTAQAQAKFPNPIEISTETIERLKREASFGLVTDKKTLEMLPHAYFVDNSEVKKVVGVVGSQLKAEFSAIVISPVNLDNLNRLKFENRNPKLHYIIRPTVLADLVLSASEKQIGCALVDFGAETTTINIYKDDVLQSIVTLPIGSRNITRDLMSGLNMTEERAEIAKSDVGSALTDGTATSSTDVEINNYISARAGEIVANILHQIEAAGFKTALPGGIILTGGGARLRNFDRLVEAQSKMPVRIASIEGSLQFKGNSFDRNSNIDILATAKNVAENFDIDCLEALPQPVDKASTSAGNHNDYDYHEAHRGGYRQVDEDNLLGDDPDDIPTTAGKKKVKGTTRPHNYQLDHETNDDDFEGTIDEDPAPSKIKGLLNKLNGYFAKPWANDLDDQEDDLDDQVK